MPDRPTAHAAPAPGISDWLLKVWLGYGAWCACTGWILSAAGRLNGTGYLISAAVTAGVAGFFARKSIPNPRRFFPRVRRFRRPLPLIYLLLLTGSLVGGIIHPPNNYDMLTYRIPRVLNWLADGRWHWIRGYIDRMNYSGTGFEWSSLPLLLVARGTSLFFLLNIASYLLLPGLVFAVLRRLGVGRRTGWSWMWLVPAGLNFVMQAGGGANDTIAVVYLLASLFFAFRARADGRVGDLWWSLVAMGLMSATKASDLPLVLPCVVALVPAMRLVKRHAPAYAAVVVVATLSSAGPILLLNFRHTGDVTGSPGDPGRLKVRNPVAGFVGNSLEMLSMNLQPPVMPLAKKWNTASERLIPGPVSRMLSRDFPRFSLHTGELPQEESAGLGIGLSLMAGISLVATVVGIFRGRPARSNIPGDPWRWPVILAGLAALLAFMCTLGSESSARLASPYYLFLLAPLLIHPVNEWLTRRRWWNRLAILAGLVVVPGLFLSPARPLFPAVRWTAAFAARHPGNAAAVRAADVYRVYSERADNLAPLRKYLPADAKTIGVMAGIDGSETALWRPFFNRRVVEVLPEDTAAALRAAGIRFIVIGPDGLDDQKTTLGEFARNHHATVVGDELITVKVSNGPEDWHVLRLDG